MWARWAEAIVLTDLLALCVSVCVCVYLSLSLSLPLSLSLSLFLSSSFETPLSLSLFLALSLSLSLSSFCLSLLKLLSLSLSLSLKFPCKHFDSEEYNYPILLFHQEETTPSKRLSFLEFCHLLCFWVLAELWEVLWTASVDVMPLQVLAFCQTRFLSLVGKVANRQWLAFSECCQLSQAIPQLHVERKLHEFGMNANRLVGREVQNCELRKFSVFQNNACLSNVPIERLPALPHWHSGFRFVSWWIFWLNFSRRFLGDICCSYWKTHTENSGMIRRKKKWRKHSVCCALFGAFYVARNRINLQNPFCKRDPI